MKIMICSACQKLIMPGQQTRATKGRHRRPIQMHAECWTRRRAQLKDSVHLAMTAHYKAIGAKCARCGSAENITADHIISREDGGTNDPWNYQPLCQGCNSSKK